MGKGAPLAPAPTEEPFISLERRPPWDARLPFCSDPHRGGGKSRAKSTGYWGLPGTGLWGRGDPTSHAGGVGQTQHLYHSCVICRSVLGEEGESPRLCVRPAVGWTSAQSLFRGMLSYRRKRSCFGVFGEGRVRSGVWQGTEAL